MAASAAVRVDDDLSAREAGIPRGAADLKPAGRVDVILRIRVQILPGNDALDDVSLQILSQLFGGDIVRVLGGKHHRVDAGGHAVAVFHRDLPLAVRAQIGKNPLFSHVRKALAQLMGKENGEGHQLRRLIRGVAEHHALIAGAQLKFPAFFGFQRVVHPEGDIRALAVDAHVYPAGIRRKPERLLRVADLPDLIPRDALEIRLRRRRDLSHDQEIIGGSAAFARHARIRILLYDRIQNSVRNLIANLVGMPFRDAFACKKLLHSIYLCNLTYLL